MALILRREKRLVPIDSTLHDLKFVLRDEAGKADIMLFLPMPRWKALGSPEALAITYEAYEEPAPALPDGPICFTFADGTKVEVTNPSLSLAVRRAMAELARKALRDDEEPKAATTRMIDGPFGGLYGGVKPYKGD